MNADVRSLLTRKLLFILTLVALPTASCTSESTRAAATISKTRERYRTRLPSTVNLRGPIEVVEGNGYWDGMTVFIKIKDAEGDSALVCFERMFEDPAKQHVYMGVRHPSKAGGKKLDIACEEEADLYGLLLRWAESPQGTADSTHRELVELMLCGMDSHFTGMPFLPPETSR